jgi:multiple sugar transport system permease protein
MADISRLEQAAIERRAAFGGEDVSGWSISAAGAIGIMLPIVVIMIFVQRLLVRGLTIGAVKG